MTRTLAPLALFALLSGCEPLTDDSGTSDSGTPSTTLPDIPTPDGYSQTVNLGAGSEARLVGEPGLVLDLPHTIVSAALSGDGAIAWFTAQYDWAPDGEKYRVYSVRTDGTELHESELVRPADAPYYPGGFQVRTSGDGETALLTQYTKDDEDRVVAQFAIASRGGDFQVVGTSHGDVESLGLAQDVFAELTDSGDAVIFNTGRRLWRADAASGWVPFQIDQVESLSWNGSPPPGNSTFGSLDITANGAEWISRVWLGGDENAVITGTSVATYGIEDVFDADVYHGLSLDDAGETVAFTVSPYTSYVGEQGGVHRQVEVPTGQVVSVDLADGGQVFCGNARTNSAVMPFFEQVDGSGRVASLTPTWTTFGDVPTPSGQLSDDGQVFLTQAPGPLVHHRVPDVFGASVDAVFTKEEADGAIVVRAVVHSRDPVVSVTVFPLLDRWMPPRALYSSDEDPLFAIRFGLELEAVENEAGHYEGRFTPRAEASLPFDERYSLRVTVNQGDNGKALSNGYRDVALQ